MPRSRRNPWCDIINNVAMDALPSSFNNLGVAMLGNIANWMTRAPAGSREPPVLPAAEA